VVLQYFGKLDRAAGATRMKDNDLAVFEVRRAEGGNVRVGGGGHHDHDHIRLLEGVLDVGSHQFQFAETSYTRFHI